MAETDPATMAAVASLLRLIVRARAAVLIEWARRVAPAAGEGRKRRPGMGSEMVWAIAARERLPVRPSVTDDAADEETRIGGERHGEPFVKRACLAQREATDSLPALTHHDTPGPGPGAHAEIFALMRSLRFASTKPARKYSAECSSQTS